jgi:hypothetical protein
MHPPSVLAEISSPLIANPRNPRDLRLFFADNNNLIQVSRQQKPEVTAQLRSVKSGLTDTAFGGKRFLKLKSIHSFCFCRSEKSVNLNLPI